MIPWATFDTGAKPDIPNEVRIQLHEHWLPWVEYGPTMINAFIDCPMLEIAHERQFVISQQGGESAGFEMDHTRRIDECLKQLDHHFHAHEIHAYHQPSSPCGIDLEHCWVPHIPWNEFPPLHLHDGQVESTYLSKSPMTVAQHPTSSSSMVSSVAPTIVLVPELAIEESDISEARAQQLLSSIPRAGSTLSINGARSTKEIRQRKKYESKLVTDFVLNERKRSSQWMVDAHEDGIEIAMRTQSIASLRTGHDQYRDTASLARISRQVEDT